MSSESIGLSEEVFNLLTLTRGIKSRVSGNKDSFCTYVTVYSGNKLPTYYIGSTQTSKILNEGYCGSVCSKKYSETFHKEVEYKFDLFDVYILKEYENHKDAIIAERGLQLKFKVIKNPIFINQAVAAPNGFFGMDVKGKLNPCFGKKFSKERKKRHSEQRLSVLQVRGDEIIAKQQEKMKVIMDNGKTLQENTSLKSSNVRKQKGSYCSTPEAVLKMQQTRADKGIDFTYRIYDLDNKLVFSGIAMLMKEWSINNGYQLKKQNLKIRNVNRQEVKYSLEGFTIDKSKQISK